MTSSPTPEYRRKQPPAHRGARLLAFLASFAMLAMTACQAPAPAGKQSRPAAHTADCMDYESVWAQLHPESLTFSSRSAASPIFRDFYSAARSDDLDEALDRWEGFQEKYAIPGGEYEDAVHARLSQWCDAELKRCHLLEEGKTASATEVASELRATEDPK